MPRKIIFISISIFLIACICFFLIGAREKMVKIVTSSGEVLGEDRVIIPKVNIEVADKRIIGPKFYRYDPPLKINTIYKSIKEARNKTPEDLMISIRSADTQEWVNFNWKEGSAPKYDVEKLRKRITRDPDLYYFELIHKLEFSRNGISVALIKHWTVKDGKKKYIIATWLEKINNRWVKFGTTLETQWLVAAVRSLKSEYLEAIVTGRKSENEVVNQMAQKCVKNGVFDIDLFKEEYMRLRSENLDALLTIVDRGNYSQ